jgi:hypothetical protein
MDQPTYDFDNADELTRNREIEGKTGTVILFSRGRWIRVLCASDANPAWVDVRKEVNEGTVRLANAEAGDEPYRRFIVPYYAKALCTEWGGFKSKGVDVPFSKEAVTAAMLAMDDVFRGVHQTVRDDKNFRGQNVEAVVRDAGN